MLSCLLIASVLLVEAAVVNLTATLLTLLGVFYIYATYRLLVILFKNFEAKK